MSAIRKATKVVVEVLDKLRSAVGLDKLAGRNVKPGDAQQKQVYEKMLMEALIKQEEAYKSLGKSMGADDAYAKKVLQRGVPTKKIKDMDIQELKIAIAAVLTDTDKALGVNKAYGQIKEERSKSYVKSDYKEQAPKQAPLSSYVKSDIKEQAIKPSPLGEEEKSEDRGSVEMHRENIDKPLPRPDSVSDLERGFIKRNPEADKGNVTKEQAAKPHSPSMDEAPEETINPSARLSEIQENMKKQRFDLTNTLMDKLEALRGKLDTFVHDMKVSEDMNEEGEALTRKLAEERYNESKSALERDSITMPLDELKKEVAKVEAEIKYMDDIHEKASKRSPKGSPRTIVKKLSSSSTQKPKVTPPPPPMPKKVEESSIPKPHVPQKPAVPKDLLAEIQKKPELKPTEGPKKKIERRLSEEESAIVARRKAIKGEEEEQEPSDFDSTNIPAEKPISQTPSTPTPKASESKQEVPPKPTTPPSARKDLLKDIQKGKQLKKVRDEDKAVGRRASSAGQFEKVDEKLLEAGKKKQEEIEKAKNQGAEEGAHTSDEEWQD